ncbi:hypothetical protein ACFL2H_11555 [Planctomycetota bacterium]
MNVESTGTLLRIDTSLVRTFAIVAIVNSHMETYYPRPEVAIGGLVGLALFFMATGMGVNASRKTRTLSFPSWFGRRILRIHPSVVASTVLIQMLLFSAWREWDITELSFSNPYVDNFFYPLSTYHFLNKIFVFYIPLYFYVRWKWEAKHVVGITCCCLLCIATAIPDIQKLMTVDEPLRSGDLNQPFLWSVFFSMTLLGVWASDCPSLFRKRPLWLSIVATITLGVLYLGCKYAMAKLGIFTEGFLLLYFFGIALSMALVVTLSDTRVLEFCDKSGPVIRWSTIGVGAISLEIYLVHTQFYMHRVGQSLNFPFNFLLFAASSLVGSIAVYWCATQIRSFVQKRL